MAPDDAASAVKEVLEGCKMLYDRSCALNGPAHESIKKLCEIGATFPGVKIRVEEQGRPISYSYLGELPELDGCRESGGANWGTYVYETTNEFYSIVLQDQIMGLRGIDSYIGVLGGTDQHIVLLNALQKSNRLQGVTLCDINPAQIFMAIMTFASYNNAVRLGELEKFTVGKSWGRMRAQALSSPISVSLEHKDMLQSISEAGCGTHFIYLSNLPALPFYLPTTPRRYNTMWLNLEDSRRLLLEVIKNQNIKDGSCVMVGTVLSNDPHEPRTGNVVLMKGDGRFRIRAHDGKFDANRLRTYLAALGDDEKFASWLTSKGPKAHAGESDVKFIRMVRRNAKPRITSNAEARHDA